MPEVHDRRAHGAVRTQSVDEAGLSPPPIHPFSRGKHGRKWRKTELTGLRGQTAADIHYTRAAQETDREAARERRFQPQSPINREHLTPHFPTLNTDQMMISGDSTITKNTREHHLQTKSPPVLSGTLGLGVDAAEISSWRNPPFGG